MSVENISFGAKPLNKLSVKKYDKSLKTFKDCPAHFVKIESTKFDLSAINAVAKKWKDAKYVKKIATASHWMNNRKYVEIDVYALTLQDKNFEILKPRKILGLVEMRNNNDNPKDRIIYHLQVKPSAMNVNNNKNKNYKHVGCGILDSLKKIYKNMSLYSDNNPNIKIFYKINGFIEDLKGSNHFSWSSNIFRRLKMKYDRFMLSLGF